MPILSSGANITLTVAAGQILTVQSDQATFDFENPVGTRVGEYAADTVFGPFASGGSVKLSSVQGPLFYDLAAGPHFNTPFDPSSVAITGGTIAPAAMDKPLVWQDFTVAANGTLGKTDSGQPWLTTWTPGLGAAQPQIVSGAYTNTASAPGTSAASHAMVNLGANCTRMGAEFSFTSGSTTTGGLAALVFWSQQLSYPGPIVDTPLHLTFSLTGWGLSSWQSQTQTQLTSGTFKTPLVGGTVYRVEVNVSGNTITIVLPDGSLVTVTQPLLASIAHGVPGWEVYQGTDCSTDARAMFSTVWADSYVPPKRAPVPSFAAVQSFFANAIKALMPAAVDYPPSAAGNVSVGIPGTNTEINSALECTFIAPPSGAVLVEFSAQISMSTAGLILWNLFINGIGTFPRQAALNVGEQIQNAKFRVTGLTPGNAYTTVWQHQASSGAGTLRLNAAGGQIATVKVSPLQ